MKLKKLHIKNFKSIVDLEIVEPSPFTVFVGPNGAGKSNIFEALEIINLFNYGPRKNFLGIYGAPSVILNRNSKSKSFLVSFEYDEFNGRLVREIIVDSENERWEDFQASWNEHDITEFNNFWALNFNRVFINTPKQIINYKGDSRLSVSSDNLEKVLKRILHDESKREEIVEWLSIFIPGFENLEIISSELSGTDTLVMYEKGTKKPFTKELLSDGTYNILALLTAVYQSDEPQFLCIEEPENGLNPFVIRKLVDFFRQACEEKGHYIWLNTHSQTLVECLTPDEMIVVDKVNVETKVKQINGMNLHGLDMAEVWLSGALGGGTPW